MKWIPQFIAWMLMLLMLSAPVRAQGDKLDPLLLAMRQQESSGNDRAVGDGGKARGPFQIWAAYWQDGCEFGDVDWDYMTDVWDVSKSRQVVRWYWQRYAGKAYRTGDLQTLARIHNGGPRGHLRRSTLKYWHRIKKIMLKRRSK